MKDASAHVLMNAIRAVMAGQYWIGRANASDIRLTARECEITAAVTSGFTNREIAERLAISGDTVRHHLTRIYGKVGVSNRLELALFAISRNLIPHG